MTADTLLFFNDRPQALPIYAALDEALAARFGPQTPRVQKTQITYTNPRVFAAVSFLPVRKKAQRPDHYITVTLGLNRRLDSPRVDAASEPYPARWTHHLLLSSPEEADDELMAWVREAAAFSAAKRYSRHT